MHIIVPMAGDGTRFRGHGLGDYKPLIKIHGQTLVEKTVKSLDESKVDGITFGIRMDHEEKFGVSRELLNIWPNCTIVMMDRTKGNLETCYNTLNASNIPENSPIVFLDCDNPFKENNILEVCLADDSEVCLLGFIDKERSNKWCYVTQEDNIVTGVYEKDIDSAGPSAVALIGFFAFKSSSYFKEIAEYILFHKKGVKGEYYTSQSIKECLSRGDKVKLVITDNFVPMGTAEDVKKIL